MEDQRDIVRPLRQPQFAVGSGGCLPAVVQQVEPGQPEVNVVTGALVARSSRIGVIVIPECGRAGARVGIDEAAAIARGTHPAREDVLIGVAVGIGRVMAAVVMDNQPIIQ